MTRGRLIGTRLGPAGAGQASAGRAPGRAARACREDAGKGAVSDAHMTWEPAEGAHTHLPTHRQLNLGLAVTLHSTRSTTAASRVSLDLHARAQRDHECTCEMQRQAIVNRCGKCVPQRAVAMPRREGDTNRAYVG